LEQMMIPVVHCSRYRTFRVDIGVRFGLTFFNKNQRG